jgi:predicted RND superfamily exporter protein
MSDETENQNGIIELGNRGFRKLAEICFDFRWPVLVFTVALMWGAGELSQQVVFDASYENYFHEGDRTYQAYEAYRDDFGSDEISYIGFEVSDLEHGPWNIGAMEKLIDLTQAFEDEVPFIYEVTSLANAELTIGTEEGLDISKIADDWPLTQEELLERREAYLAKPLLVGGIINEDADFGALILEMDRSSTDPPEEILAPEGQRPFADDLENTENFYPQVTDRKIAEILERPEYSDFSFYVSGDVQINAYYNRVLFEEPQHLRNIAMLIIGAILLVVFRSLIAATVTLGVVLLGVLTILAIMAVCGHKLGMGFGSTPTLLVAIGVAHSVHVLSEFGANLSLGMPRREALVNTMGLVGVPCLLTSITTAAGFASMSFGPIKTLAQGGLVNATGVLVVFTLSVTVLVSILAVDWLAVFRKPERTEVAASTGSHPTSALDARIELALEFVVRTNLKYRGALLWAFSAFLVLCAWGASQVAVDSNYLKDFWRSSLIYQHTVKVDSEMGGTTNVVYLFDSGIDDGIKEPATLREIDRLQQRANEEDWLVTKTYSIVDVIKDLNQSLHGDDPAYYTIPDTREAIAQYLLLYESSGGEEAEEYVTSDYRRANLELRLRMDATAAMHRLTTDLDASIKAQPFEESEVSLTGIGSLWLILLDYIVSSQLQGLSIAFSIITLLMIALFRSVKIGLISMVPNLAPVLLALGAMGWLGISLDYTKATIASICLGISVDDTIHLMTRFHHEFERRGNYEAALRAALRDVGRALVITSIALVFGFSALAFSELRSQATFGMLLSSSLVAALVADFFFMPALVLRFRPFGPEQEGGDHA